MAYTLTIKELIKRPILRNDQVYEFLNKMSDEEIKQFDSEVYESIKKEGINTFPEVNAKFMAKVIDNQILYTIFQMEL